MSEFTIKVPSSKSDNPSIVFVENRDGSTTFYSHPTTLRKIIFWVGDVVWPGWYEDDEGRAQYEKYAKDAKDGRIDIYEKGFLDVSWPRVQQHMQVDQIQIFDATKSETN